MRKHLHMLVKRSLLAHPGSVCRMLAVQIAVRILAWGPFWLPLSGKISAIWKGLAVLLLYLLFVFPLRSCAALTLARMTETKHLLLRRPRYLSLVSAGCLRFFTGLLWGIPFLFMTYYGYQYIFVFPGTALIRDLSAVGAAILPTASSAARETGGMILLFFAYLLCGILFLYGWNRSVPFDFLLFRTGTPVSAFRAVKKVRKQCKKELWINASLHFLLCLPAGLVPIMFLALKLHALFTGNPTQDIQLLIAYSQAGILSDGSMPLILSLFLIFYLPALPYRKARNAAVVINCDV